MSEREHIDDNAVIDPELTRITAEEERALERVIERASEVRDYARESYDREIIELRDAIAEARLEDVPALVAEMERLRGVADRRAEVPVGKLNLLNPYFGHLKLKEGDRTRDVLVGNASFIDTERGVRVVDWRDAPVSRIYYRYREGDEYEEEFGGRTLEGEVVARRAVVIRDGALRRINAPQGVFFRGREGWQRGERHSAKLEGGQLSAVRPPTDDERRAAMRSRGRLGVGVDGREDKHLPEIPALIDPRQFELISRPSSGLVVIQGGAGSGKTTIGLHRMAYLAFNQPRRFAPDRMLVVVFNRALARYIVRVLPGLGVEGVSVMTFEDWVSRQRRRHVARSPGSYNQDTPTVVSRVKKHPLWLKLIAERVSAAESKCTAALGDFARGLGVGDAVTRAWRAVDGDVLGRRLSKFSQWLDGERELGGGTSRSLTSRARMELQRWVTDRRRRERDIAWDWAEMVTDLRGLTHAVEKWAPGEFSGDELERVVRWSAERCARWVVVRDDDEEAQNTGRDEVGESDEKRRREDDGEPRSEKIELRKNKRRSDEDGEDGGGGDDDEGDGLLRGVDGVVEDEPGVAIDAEDDALLLRLYQTKVGALRGSGRQPLRYEHLFVDEAQDLAPVELAVLLDVTTEDRSVTLAGDTAQRLLMDNGFSDWKTVLSELGLAHVEVEPLRIGYRSTLEVLAFARAVLGHLAEPEAPLATRHGAPVEFHAFGDVGAAVAFLAEALRELSIEEPRANVAVITREAERAEVYYRALVRAEVPRLSRVADQDFSFKPGVEVTDIRQVKGLEFDYVILVDVTSGSYPDDDESRHLLHIGATRAAHQLWVVAAGTPSKLVPKWMTEGV